MFIRRRDRKNTVRRRDRKNNDLITGSAPRTCAARAAADKSGLILLRIYESDQTIMKSTLVLLPAFAVVLLLSSRTCSSEHDLATEYAFTANLHESYELFWSYDLDAKTISFAMRVRTEGWVGFGISPNGQMPGSDVVIGWVDADGKVFLHVSDFKCNRDSGPIYRLQLIIIFIILL